MKKLLTLSLVTSISLMAGAIVPVHFNKYPLSKGTTSISRGGILPDSQAISDGVGDLLIIGINGNRKQISNSTFNNLIKRNKKIIEDNPNTNINNLISNNIIQVSNDKLNKINKVMGQKLNIPDGKTCNDGNPNTMDDIYLNNICQGLSINTTLPSTKQLIFPGNNKLYSLSNGIVTLNINNRNEPYNLSFKTVSGASVDSDNGNSYNHDYIKVITNKGYILLEVGFNKYDIKENTTPYTASLNIIQNYNTRFKGQNDSFTSRTFKININNLSADDNNIQIKMNCDQDFNDEVIGYEINSANVTFNVK